MSPALARRDPAGSAARCRCGVAALLPLLADGYYLALGVSDAELHRAGTAWALFSGPTRYISLATAAFFGIGAYTWRLSARRCRSRLIVIGGAAVAIGVAVALVVGLSTLRSARRLLRHLHLRARRAGPPARDLVRGEDHHARSAATSSSTSPRSRSTGSCWRSPSLVFVAGWLIGRSRLGFALRVIGDDETVARHVGINTTRAPS